MYADRTECFTGKYRSRLLLFWKIRIAAVERKRTPKEFDLLLLLAKNQGKILTKQQIYEEVWEEDYVYDDSNIMACAEEIVVRELVQHCVINGELRNAVLVYV